MNNTDFVVQDTYIKTKEEEEHDERFWGIKPRKIFKLKKSRIIKKQPRKGFRT